MHTPENKLNMMKSLKTMVEAFLTKTFKKKDHFCA